jgi:hypothetical protein
MLDDGRHPGRIRAPMKDRDIVSACLQFVHEWRTYESISANEKYAHGIFDAEVGYST